MAEPKPTAPTLPDVIRAVVELRLAGMHVGCPGRVESYDKSTQMANVQPLLKGVRQGETGPVREALPVITNVPILFPGGTGTDYSITYPIAVGDTVWLSFSDQSLDAWSVNGGLVDPVDERRFHLSDAVGYACVRSTSQAIDNVPSDSLCLSGPKLQFGSSDASQTVLKGDAFLTAMDTLVGALYTAIASAVLPGIAATLAAAITQFQTVARALYKSTKVFVE